MADATTGDPAEDRLRQRLAKLREEYDLGMQAMSEIQRRQDELRATLLRISGAVQVLEELLNEPAPGQPVAAEQPAPPPQSATDG